ncbi:MAG: hypothetical protein LBU32_21015 [Clostridiales bacterium]|jgi:hypothetical protein|nr:hypothetical protein [Clostridiales bacterium]
MTLYETIFVRRSVRQYSQTPLDALALDEIQQYIDSAAQLSGQSAWFELVNADKLKGSTAPHAILAHGEETDIGMTNIGYVLCELDLALQSKGYGSIIMGMAKPLSPAPDYRILLAFGNTDVPPRAGESDFKRKPVLDVSNENNAIACTARLAPSAVNFQPWKLQFSPGKVTVQSAGRGIGRLMMGKVQKIDLGIILKTVEIALKHEGESITSIAPKGSGKGFSVEVMHGKQSD